MTFKTCLLVFTDLDGTLIEHTTYEWAPARPALAALDHAGAGVVLASSKTAVEISRLRSALDLEDWPAIVENGAGLLDAGAAPAHTSKEYDTLRKVLSALPKALRQHFTGFGDMDISQIVQATGLSAQEGALAQQRAFSEPGVWRGTAEGRKAFLLALAEHGVEAREGGRFLTLSFGANKASQMRTLIDRYRPRHTVALGDAPNDIEMLQAADFGVIVANPHRTPLPPLQDETTGRIIRTKDAGPLGWNKAILDLLDHLDLNKEDPDG